MKINISKCLFAFLVVGICVCALSSNVYSDDLSLTPLPGNPLRKDILNALRQEIKRIHGLDVVFVVKHLKAKDGWAWIHTQPQSQDGANHYEDVSALLQLKDGVWQVAEIPCGELENPDCYNGPAYFEGLLRRFMDVDVVILPLSPGETKN